MAVDDSYAGTGGDDQPLVGVVVAVSVAACRVSGVTPIVILFGRAAGGTVE
jgi:hypothetical protein